MEDEAASSAPPLGMDAVSSIAQLEEEGGSGSGSGGGSTGEWAVPGGLGSGDADDGQYYEGDNGDEGGNPTLAHIKRELHNPVMGALEQAAMAAVTCVFNASEAASKFYDEIDRQIDDYIRETEQVMNANAHLRSTVEFMSSGVHDIIAERDQDKRAKRARHFGEQQEGGDGPSSMAPPNHPSGDDLHSHSHPSPQLTGEESNGCPPIVLASSV
jgi:hypothetical protein